MLPKDYQIKPEYLEIGKLYRLVMITNDIYKTLPIGTEYIATFEKIVGCVSVPTYIFRVSSIYSIGISLEAFRDWVIYEHNEQDRGVGIDHSQLKAGDVFTMDIPQSVYFNEKPEVTDFKPSHYTSLPFSVDAVQIETAYNNFLYLKNKGVSEKEAFEKSVWLTYALKHLCRIGLKDDSLLEMKKAENYLRKARTGEWLKDE